MYYIIYIISLMISKYYHTVYFHFMFPILNINNKLKK